MFKKLSSALSRKTLKLGTYEEKTADLQAVFRSVAEEVLGQEYPLPVTVEYNDMNKEVLIRTPSKAAANEFSLHLEKLTKAFMSTGLEVRRIVIR